MRKYIFYLLILMLTLGLSPNVYAGLNDRDSNIDLTRSNYIRFDAISAPTGNPLNDDGWLYVKLSGTTSVLYFEDDTGVVYSLVPSTTAIDFALTADADAGDFDIQSLDKLEFIDAAVYIDGGVNGTLEIAFDIAGTITTAGTFAIDTGDWDISTAGVITNASMSADQISAANLTLGNFYLSIGTDPADAGTIRLPTAFSILAEADPTGIDVNVVATNATEDILIGSAGANSVIITPDTTIVGSLTVSGTIYESAIAPAAGNLTVNAQGAGTIQIGNASTGAITLTGGGVDIGDGAADTLTITGIIDADVTIDDGTTDSPKLIFKDSDDEQAEIYQDQASDDLEVECANADDSLAIIVGNLSSGAPNASVITINGGDLFVADDAEIDGTLVVDTDLDVNGTANISGAITLSGTITLANGLTIDNAANNVLEWNENTDEIKWTFGSNILDLSSTDVTTLAFFNNTADATFTHATNGAADDWIISLTGATDSTLRINSTGTGADALVISTSAGGMDFTVAGAAADEDIDFLTNSSFNVTTTEAIANQIYLLASGVIAGNAINIATADGGIIVNAVGAVGGDITLNAGDDILIAPTDDLTLTSTGLTLINPTETLALSSSDWGITTTGVMTKIASVGFDSGSVIYNDVIELTSQEVKALNATPKQLVAAPAAGYFIEVVSVKLILDYSTAVFTETDDNLVVQYGTSGDDITAVIEMTGFIDQAADTMMTVYPVHPQAANAAADIVVNKVELFNPYDAIAGNAGNESALTVLISYMVHAAGL